MDDDAFRDYLAEMSELLHDQNLFTSEPDDEVREAFKEQTLAAFKGMDGEVKGQLVRFLHDMKVIGDTSIIDPTGAHLDKAELSNEDLAGANLSGANLSRADLTGANLQGANLSRANLSGADLWGAVLIQADLSRVHGWGANLNKANLREADLTGARLSEASLWGADLTKANMERTYLWGANLNEANLRGARNMTQHQLALVKSLVGTILPDGTRNRE
jgi:uncharacterized protein YjbI with pentapeptide repeats